MAFDPSQPFEILDGNPVEDNLPQPSPTPYTSYSLGRSVGGADETEDRWTNKGYSSVGQNLTPGVVAVNTKVYPLGTVFKDADTNEVFIAADRHGNKNPNVVDFYTPPGAYQGQTGQRNLVVVDRVNKVPNTVQGVRDLLSKYGNVPQGESATDYLSGNKTSGGGILPKANGFDPSKPYEVVGEPQNKFLATEKPPDGMVSQGNLDLFQRPTVKNPDGSISTVRSISIETPKGVILLPTVIGDKVVTNEEAIKHYKDTGENLGIFKTNEAADAYAEELHKQQEKLYIPSPAFDPSKPFEIVDETTPADQPAPILFGPPQVPYSTDPTAAAGAALAGGSPDASAKFSDFARRVPSEVAQGAANYLAGLSRFRASTTLTVPDILEPVTNALPGLPLQTETQKKDLQEFAKFMEDTRDIAPASYGVDQTQDNSTEAKVAQGLGGVVNAVPFVLSGPGGGALLAAQALGSAKEQEYQKAISEGMTPEQAEQKSNLVSSIKTGIALPLYMGGRKRSRRNS